MKRLSRILIIIIELLVAVLVFIDPELFTLAIVAALGAVLIIVGVICGINYFRTEPNEASMKQSLAKGLLAIALGVFCIVKRDWFVNAFPVITMLYGIVILVSGIVKIEWTVDAIRLGKKRWYLYAIAAVVTLIFAALILLKPFEALKAMWIFLGITLCIQAVIDLIALITVKIATDRAVETDPNVYEGTVVDDGPHGPDAPPPPPPPAE